MSGLFYLTEHCPCCGEPLELTVDSSGEDCEYFEDCQICCAPILVRVHYDLYNDDTPEITLIRDNE